MPSSPFWVLSQHIFRLYFDRLSPYYRALMDRCTIHCPMLQSQIIMSDEKIKVVSTNRKAGFEYFLLEHYEAGLSLQGSEIKSIRAGQISLAEAFIEVEQGHDAWLVDAHIAPYIQANRFNHDPMRRRRLLMHRKEILKLWNEVRQKGVTIIPLKVYLKNGRAKIEIALARGKKTHDKREAIAKRDEQRDALRNL